MSGMTTARLLFRRRICWLLLASIAAGALFSPLVPPLTLVPNLAVLLLLGLVLPWVLGSTYQRRQALIAGLACGLAFALSQSTFIWLVERSSKIFTGFYIYDQGWSVPAFALMGGMTSMLVHAFRQRKWLYGCLFALLAVTAELVYGQYFLVKRVLSPELWPARTYLFPLALACCFLAFFLLSHFYSLTMLGNFTKMEVSGHGSAK
jgi:hypothetical protein